MHRHKLRGELSAFSRAISMNEPEPAHRSGDEVASVLLPASLRALSAPALRMFALRWLDQIAPGLYGYLVASTRHVDRLLAEALVPEVRQLVILGAGFDTRAQRFEALTRCDVYEVDDRAILRAKQQRLRRRRLAGPHLRFVECDLVRDPVGERLSSAGYDVKLLTIFLCLGVTPFMRESSIRSLLWLVSHAPVGSELIFDFARADMMSRLGSGPSAQDVVDAMGRRVQHVVGAIDTRELATILRPYGLEPRSMAGGRELRRTYFGELAGSLPVAEIFGVVAAVRVPLREGASRSPASAPESTRTLRA